MVVKIELDNGTFKSVAELIELRCSLPKISLQCQLSISAPSPLLSPIFLYGEQWFQKKTPKNQ